MQPKKSPYVANHQTCKSFKSKPRHGPNCQHQVQVILASLVVAIRLSRVKLGTWSLTKMWWGCNETQQQFLDLTARCTALSAWRAAEIGASKGHKLMDPGLRQTSRQPLQCLALARPASTEGNEWKWCCRGLSSWPNHPILHMLKLCILPSSEKELNSSLSSESWSWMELCSQP